MNDAYHKVERMWWSERQPPLLLRGASSLYAAINAVNLKLRAGRAQLPPLPLVSVGNITAGGSGKTPFVIWLAGELRQRGFHPVVLCRGDGGNKGAPQLLSRDSDPLLVGDEAVLLFQQSGCPVIAGRDRIRAARMAAEYGDIIILDDGFQYRQLKRICDIVLLPAAGIGNGYMIPAGPMREPLQALGRADLIVRSGHADAIRPLTNGREWRWTTAETELIQLAGNATKAPERAAALSAIARPERFLASLERLGIVIVESRLFPDHHRFSGAEAASAAHGSLPVICTAKDAVKLKALWPTDRQLWVLQQRPDAEAGLIEAIVERIKTAAEEGADADA